MALATGEKPCTLRDARGKPRRVSRTGRGCHGRPCRIELKPEETNVGGPAVLKPALTNIADEGADDHDDAENQENEWAAQVPLMVRSRPNEAVGKLCG